MPDPLVTVIIPAYNAERFVHLAVESVLWGTYDNLDVIVVDDGSTDGTAHIVRRFTDPRLRYVRRPNGGPGAARNTGLQLAKGRYITFLDSDDYYLPTKIADQVDFLRGRTDIGYGAALHFETGRPARFYARRGPRPSGNILPWLMGEPVINPNTVMYPRQVFDIVGCFNDTYNFPEEWEWYIRCCQAGFMFAYQAKYMVVVQVRPDSMIGWHNQVALRERTIKMLRRLFPEPFAVGDRTYDPTTAIHGLERKLRLARIAEKPYGLPLRMLWRWNRLRDADWVHNGKPLP